MYLYYTNIIPPKPAAVKGVNENNQDKIGYLMGHIVTVLSIQQVTGKYDFVYLTVLNSAKEKTTANNRVIAAAVLISRLCLSQAFRELESSRVSAVEDVQERLPHVVRVSKIGRTRSD